LLKFVQKLQSNLQCIQFPKAKRFCSVSDFAMCQWHTFL